MPCLPHFLIASTFALAGPALGAEVLGQKTNVALTQMINEIGAATVAGTLHLEKGEYPVITARDSLWKPLFSRFAKNAWFVDPSGTLIDEWGSPLSISVTPTYVRVTSVGPDGILNNPSDNITRTMMPVPKPLP